MKEPTTLDIITYNFLEQNRENFYTFYEPGSKEKLDMQGFVLREKLKESKHFLLNVEKTQVFYDKYESLKEYPESNHKEFNLPFDTCLFAFEKPLIIKWSAIRNRKFYDSTKLLAMIITNKPDVTATNTDPKDILLLPETIPYFENFTERTSYPSPTSYQVFLIFEEETVDETNTQKLQELKEEGKIGKMLSNQAMYFTFVYDPQGNTYLYIQDHYPCQDKLLCVVGKNGQRLYNDQTYYCQEVLARDALIETIFSIVNKIHSTTTLFREKEKSNLPRLPFSLPFGWPWTKGNLPKDDYVLYMDSLRYKYNPDDINYGTGIKHRYRYDVRRHPRIVDGKIIWVNPHQRGSGKYIRKVYSNRRTWYINYLWYQAEKLTKYRIFEILFIRAVYFFRKIRNKK